MIYIVYTPAYERRGEHYYSPPEYGSDVVEVEADTRRQAAILGMQELRRINSQWVRDMESDNRNPFNGIKVEAIDDCLLGRCHECGSELGNPKAHGVCQACQENEWRDVLFEKADGDGGERQAMIDAAEAEYGIRD